MIAVEVPDRAPGAVHDGLEVDAAGLARMVTELLHLPEDLVDVTRVLAKEPALKNESVGLAAAVAHASQDLQAVAIGQPEVEHDRVVMSVYLGGKRRLCESVLSVLSGNMSIYPNLVANSN